MRETKKAGKRIPTDEEFEELNKEYFGEIIYTGYRYTNGSFDDSFDDLGTDSYFWSSTESGSRAWYRFLYYSTYSVTRSKDDKALGFSVRCVQE
jgi:uncharacterized protein (TIGR02145 family)